MVVMCWWRLDLTPCAIPFSGEVQIWLLVFLRSRHGSLMGDGCWWGWRLRSCVFCSGGGFDVVEVVR
jgi:hypothetical protein